MYWNLELEWMLICCIEYSQADQSALENIARQSTPQQRRGSKILAGLQPTAVHPQIMVSEASVNDFSDSSSFCGGPGGGSNSRRGSTASIGPVILPVGSVLRDICI